MRQVRTAAAPSISIMGGEANSEINVS
jgi:hypothetical protein